MKIIAIGDTHGSNHWESIVEKENDADKIVFIGDYFDSFKIPFGTQMENFKKIIQYKKENMDKVVLIIGNHDYQYIMESERYSGFQERYAEIIKNEIQKAIDEDLLQACFLCDKYLFSHAGFTNTWCTDNLVSEDIQKETNYFLKSSPQRFKFTPSNMLDNSGDSITQSPIWVRPRALLSDKIEGAIQVVGHTRQKEITEKDGVYFIDVLDTVPQYLEIKIEVNIRSL